MISRISSLIQSSLTIRVVSASLLLGILMLIPELAVAQEVIPLPYEKGLGQFQKSLEGPVPFAISLFGIVGCGAMLIFGGEISGFMRTMLFIVLVVAVIVQASSVVTLLGGKGSLGNTTSLYIPSPARVA
jgi:type IV secretion system protein VirB2